MTLTYTGTLTTDLDRIRFWLQDTTAGSGILPGGANFTDAELNALLSTTTGSWQRAVLAAIHIAASAWAKHEHSLSVEGYSESPKQAAALERRAVELQRQMPGVWAGVTGLGISDMRKLTDIS